MEVLYPQNNTSMVYANQMSNFDVFSVIPFKCSIKVKRFNKILKLDIDSNTFDFSVNLA